MYRLTNEGRTYLEKGLPEVNLVNSLDRPIPISEAKSRVDNFNIAFL